MKIVVYWEHSDERAKAVGLIAPLQKFARQWVKSVVVRSCSMADALAQERAEFNQDVEDAFGMPFMDVLKRDVAQMAAQTATPAQIIAGGKASPPWWEPGKIP